VIRILLVEYHGAFCQALAFLLDREPDLVVVGTAGTVAEARPQLPGVDVAILDPALPDGDGWELIEPFRAANPGAKVLLLADADDPGGEVGPEATLPKSAGLADIIGAVRRLGESGLAL
jgi:DNA-binding NarL/FixJ family response regulator